MSVNWHLRPMRPGLQLQLKDPRIFTHCPSPPHGSGINNIKFMMTSGGREGLEGGRGRRKEKGRTGRREGRGRGRWTGGHFSPWSHSFSSTEQLIPVYPC